ncbi:MAG TPA: ABC transporter permease [Candidatus Eisenbacteria bacterium]|nr:ABC transporter permease [Candidatus Eisenbacteria bacterium]
MANNGKRARPYPRLGETVSVAIETFRSNKVRFTLTALGMVIGTASLILVVTIGLSGKQYVLQQIQSIGANMIFVSYEGGAIYSAEAANDYMTIDDLRAIRQQVPNIVASSPIIELHERITVPGGRERDVMVLGVAAEYYWVRNLQTLTGRFLEDNDTQSRGKVAVITQNLADTMYGSTDAAVGQTIKLSGLPFVVVGTFRERVDTFGQSEISDDTILIPYTVARFFTATDTVKTLYFSVADPSDIAHASARIQQILQSRHRPESVYKVDDLTQLLTVAGRIANALTTILLLIAVLTLLVSGVGIMNIMLATVNARIREIGVRKAVGATNAEIRAQFLAEAVLISLTGGLVGTAIGMALPISVRVLTSYRIPISGLSVIIAILVSSLIGVMFGTMPAARAARLDPVESLRWE